MVPDVYERQGQYTQIIKVSYVTLFVYFKMQTTLGTSKLMAQKCSIVNS